jgi:diguanylate cyclase (GGDEF)-like protein
MMWAVAGDAAKRRGTSARLAALLLTGAGLEGRAQPRRFASTAYLAGGLLLLAVTSWDPTTGHRSLALGMGAALLASGGTFAAVPERWWPGGSLLPAYLGLGFSVFGVFAGLPVYAGVLLAALAFLYVGLTQPPGYPARLVLPAVAVMLAACSPDLSAAEAGQITFAVLGTAAVGEVVALSASRAGKAQESLERLLLGLSELARCQLPGEAADQLAASATDLVGCDGALVLALSGPRREDRVTLLGRHRIDAATVISAPHRILATATSHTLHSQKPLWVALAEALDPENAVLLRRLGIASALLVPLHTDGEPDGVLLCAWSRTCPPPEAASTEALDVLAGEAWRQIARLRSVDQLTAQARTDPLTGLPNRRAFLHALRELPPDGVVLFLDLDHFKDLNDERGNAAGDDVLRTFGSCLAASVRDGDCAARFGGEEFSVVVPAGGEEAGLAIVDRLQRRWVRARGPVTFSAGVAVHRPLDTPAATLARADSALYAAKAAGRDRVVVADERIGPRPPHRGPLTVVPDAPLLPRQVRRELPTAGGVGAEP